jgi:hypothetical protein
MSAFSELPTPPRRLGELIRQFDHLMEPILTVTIELTKRYCDGCSNMMCDILVFGGPHTCTERLECEPAYRMRRCGHICGQECLLRCLERYGECPICYNERRREADREWLGDQARTEEELLTQRSFMFDDFDFESSDDEYGD